MHGGGAGPCYFQMYAIGFGKSHRDFNQSSGVETERPQTCFATWSICSPNVFLLPTLLSDYSVDFRKLLAFLPLLCIFHNQD
jgi:hypothetical protein